MTNVTMIVDLQFGSTGKGLLAGYLAQSKIDDPYDVVVNCNMPNAGHTYIDIYGNKMIHKVLPSGIVGPGVEYALLGPGSVFDIGRLCEEVAAAAEIGYNNFEVVIHPNAVPLLSTDKNDEQSLIKSIGSTGQGSLIAQVRKMSRNHDSCALVRDWAGIIKQIAGPHMPIHVVHNNDYDMIIGEAENILAEGSQGHSLGINEAMWPFTTSRDCSPSRFMSDMGIPWDMLEEVIGVARVHPIRVGGNSGPCYPDQEELSWEILGQKPETTTVTGRERRVFSWSNEQFARAVHHCCPSRIFLNFCNYARSHKELSNLFKGASKAIGSEIVSPFDWTGWGPSFQDVHHVTSQGHGDHMRKLISHDR